MCNIDVIIIVIDTTQASFSDVSKQVYGGSRNGIIAAFGDFNADKATDIFILTNEGKSLDLLVAHTDLSDGPFTTKSLISSSAGNGTLITGVVPADFDGDSQMDVLVTRRKTTDPIHQVSVYIHWGNSKTVLLDGFIHVDGIFKDQPAIVDANGDMIPDLMGENITGDRNFWIFNANRTYSVVSMKNGSMSDSLPKLRIPQSSAFVDVNNDLDVDLCVVSESNDGSVQLEIWLNENGVFTWNRTISTPTGLKVLGQLSFSDIDDDHSMDVVLPACHDTECKDSAIYVYSKNAWHRLNLNLKSNGAVWGFVPPNQKIHPLLTFPLTLRIGDLNLNGYPDILAILTTTQGSNVTTAAFVLSNVPCTENCDGFSQTFEIDFKNPLLKTDTPFLVSFFDLTENGILDIVLSSFESQHSKLYALAQAFAEDACFMKVMVISGRCLHECPGHHKPYGVNQVGPVVRFQTTNSNGNQQIGIASQLSQTAHFALQLPFIVFGLGQMPNFVDKLEVGIPSIPGETQRSKDWKGIIPNSQLVVIPFPLNQPYSWTNMLFVTPSRAVLLTGASLLGTCAFIAFIVAILHWRERVEDKREKLQESHRFHFDAM